MAIALTLRQYLADRGVEYDLMPHEFTQTSMRTAEASHVPGDSLAKAVLLKRDGGGYLLAVLPASCHLRIDELMAQVDRSVELASEQEVETLFGDCVRGAVPPIGAAYGVDVIVDDGIAGRPDIWFEAGDHATLIHMTGDQFARLTAGMPHGQFSRHD